MSSSESLACTHVYCSLVEYDSFVILTNWIGTLRIAYVGNFKLSHCTEVHLGLTLESLGHSVERFQEDECSAELVFDRLSTSPSTDLFLWTRTWGLKGDAHALLREAPCPTVAYHLDLYAGLKRENLVDEDPWWRSTLVCTADGGSDEFWKAHDVNHAWIPAGVFDRECYLTDPIARFRYDVAFVGNAHGYHPEWPYRGMLVEWLKKTYGTRFLKAGWPEESVRGHALNQLYASVKVVVGDTLCLGFRHPRYWSDRVYETIGRGGFLIHPFVEGMQEHFDDGKHLRFYQYGNWDQLQDLIDYYVSHDTERERIRQAGHEHVKRHHTYRERMRSMLALVEGA